MNKLNYGRAYFRFGDKSEEVDINAGPVARTRSMFYKSFVASGRTLEACYDGATPRIGRFSKLRLREDRCPLKSEQGRPQH